MQFGRILGVGTARKSDTLNSTVWRFDVFFVMGVGRRTFIDLLVLNVVPSRRETYRGMSVEIKADIHDSRRKYTR